MTTPTEQRTPPIAATGDALFAGPGEMRALCRALDWSATPLGPVDAWPRSLRTVVAMMLASRHPMFLFWGRELVQLYNDAYRPSLAGGGRHPRALGMRGADFWTEIWDIIGPQIDQVMSGGEATWHVDHLVPIERNGRIEEVYWTYGYSPVHDDEERVGGTLVVCQETTARVLGERRLQALSEALAVERERLAVAFRQAPAFLAVLRGRDYVLELVNDAYYRLVGHRDVIGRPLVEAIPEVRDQGFIEILDRVLATGEPFVGREIPIRLVRAAGAPADDLEERFLDFVYQPLVEADGTRSRIIALGSDVTEQVTARREIERLLAESERARAEAEAARKEADTANRAKSDFLAVMSHELRTPLNAIAGYAELLELGVHGPLTAEQLEAIRRLQKSERHLLGLVNGILDYARIESGNVDYVLTDVAVDEAMAACEALVAPQLRAKALSFDVVRPPRGLAVRTDREKLQQILVNLLANAVKFTERGGRIALHASAGDGEVFFAVEDTGRGIPARQLDRIFEPFVQVDPALTRTHEGAGLGLAISRDLARGMGGDISVRSTPGEGSTFTLRLPMAKAGGGG